MVINNCIVELDAVEEISAAEIKASSSHLFGEESPYVGWFVGCVDTSYLFIDYVYEIEYDGNGSTSGEMPKSGEISYGTIEQLAENQFVKTGYTFIGWECSVSGGFYGMKPSKVTTINDGSSIISDLAYVTQLVNVSGGTVTFTAQWRINTYIVTWEVNGNTTTTEVEYGTIPSYTGSTPTKAPTFEYAYSFVGWSTSLNGEVISLPEVTNDATYYAVFKQASVAYYSLTVKETIGVNLYLDVAKYTSDINAYVELEYNHNAINYIPNIQTDRIYLYSATQSDGMYKFSLSFASGQIADEINIRLYSSSDELLFNKLNLSILTYCETVISKSEDTNLVKLCKSIIDYGKYSKEYFEYAQEVEIDKTDLVLPQSIKQEHLLQGLTQNEITSE